LFTQNSNMPAPFINHSAYFTLSLPSFSQFAL